VDKGLILLARLALSDYIRCKAHTISSCVSYRGTRLSAMGMWGGAGSTRTSRCMGP
jgi:hypothetical protein